MTQTDARFVAVYRLRCALIRKLARLLAVGLMLGLSSTRQAHAQNESDAADAGTCTLRNHVYTCNGTAFQAALFSAKTVAVQVHNSDGVARNQLTEFLTKKMGKTIAADRAQPELVFLLIPIDPSGVVNSIGDADLGTLRVYSAGADGSPEHLLWAETYSGAQDLPWPTVVHGLVLQFQSHFHIK